jgi:hypothetical protein
MPRAKKLISEAITRPDDPDGKVVGYADVWDDGTISITLAGDGPLLEGRTIYCASLDVWAWSMMWGGLAR